MGVGESFREGGGVGVVGTGGVWVAETDCFGLDERVFGGVGWVQAEVGMVVEREVEFT